MESIDPYEETKRALAEANATSCHGPLSKKELERLSTLVRRKYLSDEDAEMVLLALSEQTPSGYALRKAFLTQEPQKQNAAERTVQRMLAELKTHFGQSGETFYAKKLPSKGARAVVLAEGHFRTLGDGAPPASASKTMDFSIRFRSRAFYMPAKYTSGGGGTQDNTRREIESLIRGGVNLTDGPDLLILADGDHYGLQDINGQTHLDNLRAAASATNRIIVLTHKELWGFFANL